MIVVAEDSCGRMDSIVRQDAGGDSDINGRRIASARKRGAQGCRTERVSCEKRVRDEACIIGRPFEGFVESGTPVKSCQCKSLSDFDNGCQSSHLYKDANDTHSFSIVRARLSCAADLIMR